MQKAAKDQDSPYAKPLPFVSVRPRKKKRKNKKKKLAKTKQESTLASPEPSKPEPEPEPEPSKPEPEPFIHELEKEEASKRNTQISYSSIANTTIYGSDSEEDDIDEEMDLVPDMFEKNAAHRNLGARRRTAISSGESADLSAFLVS